jgi:tetratricopeptide (TPR) repeat protein
LLLVLTAARPACAEWEIAHAAVAETRGATDEAIARYRHALTLDGWPALNLDLYERIGAIDGNFGRIKTVEYGIYHAELSITQIDPTKAVSELAALLPRTTEPLTGLLHRRIAEILAQQARALHAYAAYGAAAAKCKEALSHDPDALLPAYYLSRELYLIGAYREASAFTEQTLKRVDDPVLRANLFANLGDAQTELGAYDAAKVAYRNSYQYDYLLNLRSLSALNGP